MKVNDAITAERAAILHEMAEYLALSREDYGHYFTKDELALWERGFLRAADVVMGRTTKVVWSSPTKTVAQVLEEYEAAVRYIDPNENE
jgi:hypothetical protein